MDAASKSITEALAKRNQSIDEYFEKFRAYEDLRALIQRLMAPIQKRQKTTMDEISERLDELEGYFVELGYLDEGGQFDLASYQRMRVIRRIADGKIRALEEVPAAFRDEFEDAFLADARTDEGLDFNGELYRQTEVIRDEMESTYDCLKRELGPVTGLNVREGFEEYLVDIKDVPQPLQQLICNLNELWFDYKDAARAVACHF